MTLIHKNLRGLAAGGLMAIFTQGAAAAQNFYGSASPSRAPYEGGLSEMSTTHMAFFYALMGTVAAITYYVLRYTPSTKETLKREEAQRLLQSHADAATFIQAPFANPVKPEM